MKSEVNASVFKGNTVSVEGGKDAKILNVFFGVLGFLLRRRGFSVAPVTLGMVLGGMMDSNFRRAVSLASTAESPLMALFGRPITMILLVVTILTLLSNIPAVKNFRASRRMAKAAADEQAEN